MTHWRGTRCDDAIGLTSGVRACGEQTVRAIADVVADGARLPCMNGHPKERAESLTRLAAPFGADRRFGSGAPG